MDAIRTESAPQDVTTNARRALDEGETHYMRRGREPVTSSVLISNSKYLNDPYYRDVFAQVCLRRYGHDLEPTYMIPSVIKAVTQVTDSDEAQRLVDAEKAKNPEFRAFLIDRPDLDLRIENTAHYEEGTLGAVIHEFLASSGMKIDFMYAGETLGDLDYIAKRLLAIHDIAHLVTGFGPNSVGEVALATCILTTNVNYFSPELATYLNHVNTWVPVGGIMHNTLHYPAVMPLLYDGIRQGITAGQAIRLPFFMTDWMPYLDRPLDALAQDCGFVRGPGDEWAWTTAAATG